MKGVCMLLGHETPTTTDKDGKWKEKVWRNSFPEKLSPFPASADRTTPSDSLACEQRATLVLDLFLLGPMPSLLFNSANTELTDQVLNLLSWSYWQKDVQINAFSLPIRISSRCILVAVYKIVYPLTTTFHGISNKKCARTSCIHHLCFVQRYLTATFFTAREGVWGKKKKTTNKKRKQPTHICWSADHNRKQGYF